MITDPINSVYGGISPEHYRQLRQAGVDVIDFQGYCQYFDSRYTKNLTRMD
jgi:hypothetical protein